ncbi:hypothetical protein EV183_001193 [Coemansia sp. RSA 2336]|nr:hypothetical protein EV183_001193 [Coemansia sp. RSA 2336]
MSQPTDFNYNIKPKGILKKTADTSGNNVHLRWDEDNLRITEAQKDSTMKVDEPRTPYIHYNQENDVDLEDLEDLKLTSGMSSRSSSVASSPKRAQVVAPFDWASESEDEAQDEESKAKHERFQKMRQQHYHSEAIYIHQDKPYNDSDDSMGSADDDTSADEANGTSGIDRGKPLEPALRKNAASATPDAHVSKGFKETYGVEDEPTN